ncbi:MAG: hypothetical protein GY716_23080 [bacterium]|nr:hypothetical protein [bacterium]
MMRRVLIGLALVTLSTLAFTSNVVNGVLDNTDPIWDGCGGSTSTGCYYDVVELCVDASGAYTFDAVYAGSGDTHLDGILEIYQGAFNPASPGVNSIGYDDDGPEGSHTSQIFGLGLSTGTT